MLNCAEQVQIQKYKTHAYKTLKAAGVHIIMLKHGCVFVLFLAYKFYLPSKACNLNSFVTYLLNLHTLWNCSSVHVQPCRKFHHMHWTVVLYRQQDWNAEEPSLVKHLNSLMTCRYTEVAVFKMVLVPERCYMEERQLQHVHESVLHELYPFFLYFPFSV